VTGRGTLERFFELGAGAQRLPRRDTCEDVRAVFAPAELPDVWVRTLARLATTPLTHWKVQVVLDGAVLDTLEVVDGDASGMWSLTNQAPEHFADEFHFTDEFDAAAWTAGGEDDADADADAEAEAEAEAEGGRDALVALAPTTPTAVWAWLSRLAGISDRKVGPSG
jgi:hypothetical protein